MTTRSSMTALAFFSLALLFSAGIALAASESFSQTYPLAADGRLSLENLNGNVTIEGWGSSEIQIEYTKTARSAEALARVEVVIEAHQDHVSIESDYSEARGRNNEGASVDFTIRVPHGARLDEIELVNGDLTLSGISGKVNASLVNGEVEARSLSGSVELESVNGEINLTFDALGDGQSIEIESVNGAIEIALPADANATIEAETVHGPIDNDFGIEVERGRYVGTSMKGTVGNGSARVSLENVNGSIKVNRS